MENGNTVDIKLIITEQPKTSHKLSKTIRQAENGFQVVSGRRSNKNLYSVTKNVETFWMKKM